MPNPHPSNLMDLREFRDQGYLQEVNRRFFHPLGLALALVADEATGEVTGMAGLIDAREDPEGFFFSDALDPHKATFIDAQMEVRTPHREKRLGYVIQPVPDR